MTSPFSIYIVIGLTYPDYKAKPFAAYIDSGLGICLSKSACFPEEYHTDLPAIQGKDISNQNIILTKGIKHPRILISKYIVKLPLLYFHNIGCDILLGNNFLQLLKLLFKIIFPILSVSKYYYYYYYYYYYFHEQPEQVGA